MKDTPHAKWLSLSLSLSLSLLVDVISDVAVVHIYKSSKVLVSERKEKK